MPRRHSNGGRVTRGPAGRMPSPPNSKSLKELVGALRNLWPFVAMVWHTSPQLTAASLLLRLLSVIWGCRRESFIRIHFCGPIR
jgi:ATP-binding cassette subfamily B protein